MSINHEVKGHLARLLATEDLVVEHKQVETACFNVHSRVLTLPLWEKATNGIYDMLVGHEVGHALYTPDEDWSENLKIPPQFVNVTEDARVEKLMKRRYAGLSKTFFKGYKELNDDDFFQIGDEDVSTFNLADRANLYFKLGNFISVQFTPEEKDIVDLIADAETFQDSLDAAERLYEYCKKEEKEGEKVPSLDNHETTQSGGGDTQEMGDQSEINEEQNDEGSSTETQTNMEGGDEGGETAEPEVKTVTNLEDKLRDLVNMRGRENIYIELPKLNLDTVINSNEEVHTEIKNYWKECEKKFSQSTDGETHKTLFLEVDKQYHQFKRSAQKEVNYLVKEFECKKAADSYARATTSRTGVLDCTKLPSYKYNEDLFKKVTTLATGKNHGLVFVLDWSGSMADVMVDTIKQLYNLMWFCKKVNIPFEVYAFTHEFRRPDWSPGYRAEHLEPHYKKDHGLMHVDESFSLMNLFTSKTTTRVLEEQMVSIHRIANTLSYRNNGPIYGHPNKMSLSGTPLNEALVVMNQILPKFQQENKLQKVQCVVLTDGEAPPLKFHKEFHNRLMSDGKPYIGLNNVGSDVFLRDRKTGRTYKFSDQYHQFTDVLLQNLRDKFVDVNFIGMRILQSRDAGNFIRRYYETADYSTGRYQNNKEYEKIMNEWKKTRTCSILNSGYNVYFGLSSSDLSNDTEFEVAEDATKNQIKSAFFKSLKGKKMNKKVLGEFIELVA